MAELVAGAFLQSSFQVIIEKLASVDIRDYIRSNNVDGLVKELRIALDSINQVLDEAEIKQYQIPHVKKWLNDLKHVVYEADQLLDEISTDTMLNKLKDESEFVSSNLFGLFSVLTTNPFESRLNQQLDKLELLEKQKKELGLGEGSISNEGLVSSKPSKISPSTALVDESRSRTYGRDDDKEKLIKLLLAGNSSGNQVPIISILGLGGMGKTTLAQLVYNDPRTKEHFQLKAWVYVSESFDLAALTKAILESFGFSANGDLNQLQLKLQEELMGKKYLLVLDDIWNGDAECWELLLLPFNHGSSGSKIMVTTREKEVADYVMKSTKLFDLHQLDKSNCWSLFETHAFRGKSVCDHPNLESIGRKIVDKCGGLPLAIKSLGQLLRKKFSLHEWTKILETDMWRLSDVDLTINSVLRLSYHNLPSDLKRCFAYCSIFPKGYKFEKDDLIKLWMAEGLLECCVSGKSEEEFGNEIFDSLESISFFQQSFNERYGTYEPYVMHDLVNDLTKSVSGEFCMQIEGARVESSLERTRHIWWSLQFYRVDHKSLKPIFELTGLRSLILKGMSISKYVQHDLFSGLKYLRMLKFKDCSLSELVDEICNLKLLRYLDLSHTKITSLPDTICMLYNLQTLLLQHCSKLTELPSNFSKLVNLCHLELPSDFGRRCLNKMPKHMGKLNKLQTLSYFIVEEQNGSDLKELSKLNSLHGTIEIEGLGNVSDLADAATVNLKDMKYLENLYMRFDGRREEAESNVSVLEALQPNNSLKMLNITQYKGNSFPNWIWGYQLPNLVSLKLQSCGLCSHLPPLGQLPCLKELSICDCDGIKIIGEEFHGNNSTNVPFLSLEVLKFEEMNNWEEWFCLEGFPLLKKLYISDCPKLKRALPQRQHLPSLQKLEIYRCAELEEFLCFGEFPLLKEISIIYCSKLKRALPQHLPSLQELEISDCEELEEFLCLGEFPLLKEISIKDCPKLKRVLPHHLPSLQELEIYKCAELEEFLCLGEFPLLKEISIKDCPKLKRVLPQHLPSLQKLKISDCKELEEFLCLGEFPLLKELHIRRCPKLKRVLPQHLPSLQELEISDCDELEECLCLGEFPLLKEISIKDCPKLKRVLPQHLPSLHELEISECEELEECLCLGEFPLLKDISIKDCPKLKRVLPQHLPSLQKLKISDCKELEECLWLGECALLKEISIMDCPKLKRVLPQHLLSLQKLKIIDCKELEECLRLGEFPLLKELYIRRCPKLKRVLPQHLPSLQKLEISDCNELEECICLEGFPLLKELYITNCPKLKKALPKHLPSLQKLFINDCNKLEASIPKGDSIIVLVLQRCDRILINELPTSLKNFVLRENRYTEFFVEEILVNNTILQVLDLDFSGSLKCPFLDLCCYNSLRTLTIIGLRSSSLSFSLHLFTNLDSLNLYDCPELESFPEGGLPSNLWWLKISNCPKLIASREEWGLFQLSSLKHFIVLDHEFENVESFPEENLLPPTLKSLDLHNCSKLRIMNKKGFLHLKSLKELYIYKCPSLECLPEAGLPNSLSFLSIEDCPLLKSLSEEGLPNSLSTLWIRNCPSLELLPKKEGLLNSLSHLCIQNCPLIKEKCQKEGGERWHTISHIPHVIIDRIWQKKLDVAKEGGSTQLPFSFAD